MGGQSKSKASALASAAVRRLWEEPTEAFLATTKRDAVGVLSVNGEEDVKICLELAR